MIKNKNDLYEYIKEERPLYIKGGLFTSLKLWLLQDSAYLLWHYVKMLRKTEYYYNIGNKIMYWVYERRKNKEGVRLGISINHNCIGKGLLIYHYGSIIINSNAQIGENFRLHGCNCVGNKGENGKFDAPKIGNNVELGVGAQVLGNIIIASNIVIAANAVVVKDFFEPNFIVAGIPAKIKKRISYV